jgi:single-strand DNA-binding protein
MNTIMLSGRLVKDAEITSIGVNNVPKLKFSIAVERAYQKDKNNKVVDYIDCEVLGNRANALAPYLIKGKSVLLNGELNIDKYKNKDGETRIAVKVKVDRLEFIGGNSNNNGGGNSQPVVIENITNDVAKAEAIELDDDDVPF